MNVRVSLVAEDLTAMKPTGIEDHRGLAQLSDSEDMYLYVSADECRTLAAHFASLAEQIDVASLVGAGS